MLLRLVRRLLGLGVSLTLVLGVTTYVGPQLSARSMTGYLQVLDHAQTGHYAEADSISASLQRDWRALGDGVARAVADLQRGAARLTAHR
jgi:hypothetical protein